MSTTSPILLCGLLLCAASSVSTLQAEATQTQSVQTNNLTDGEVQMRLDSILIQDFAFKRVKLSQALASLDKQMSPYGLQIIFKPTNGRDPEVNLKTRDLSLAKNLSYLSQQAAYDWHVENGVVIISEPGSGEQLVTEIFVLKSPTAYKLAKAGGFE